MDETFMTKRVFWFFLTFLPGFIGFGAVAFAVGIDESKVVSAKSGTGADLQDSGETKILMDSIFAPMSRVLPKSFSDTEFVSAANRSAIQADLDLLATQTGLLKEHGKTKNRNFEYVARSLSRDAANVKRWYRLGNYEEARFTLHNMTENCISCHSTLPSPTSSKFTGNGAFFKDIDFEKLPALERAHFQVMTRQYDAALTTYESFLTSSGRTPIEVLASAAFVDYLKVSICAMKEQKRPLAFLKTLDQGLEAASRAKNLTSDWVKVLSSDVNLKLTHKSALTKARELIGAGKKKMDYPGDKAGLIQFVVAESLLLNFINSTDDRGPLVAEAYYNLGIAESVLEHAFWLSKADFYLESAVRLAPSSPFARKAFAMLEERMILGFTGSGGTKLPNDIVDMLDELKKILKQNQ